ncbi:MAG TPA: hypothetical protein VJM14_08880 [Burkholderiales bacterium]|nr:hypothetical protein [Burkholderiales bacterium]
MDLSLPLPFIGWFFTIASVLALGLGAILIMSLHKAGELERRVLSRTAWNDVALFGIWFLGLAGGIGVLALKPWGRHILEFFCWTLIVLVALSAATRLYVLKRQRTPEAVNWLPAAAGLFVVVIPIVAICAATIVTLRSEAVRQAFSG